MDPSQPVTPPEQPQNPPAVSSPQPAPASARPKGRSRILAAIGLKRLLLTLVVVIVAAGAGYYIGWHVGYKAADTGCFSVTANAQPIPCPPPGSNTVDEPVIYLYPPKIEPVNVKVDYPAGFSSTTPTYNPASGWQVLATPSGMLTNATDGKQYPYLIWEGNPPPIRYDMSTGFVVPGNQTGAFLRSELPIIGLSPTETDAFIAYWQPKMVANKYNLIHFAGKEYTDYAKLIISPEPDSTLRVLMAYEPLQQPVAVQPQVFPEFQRHGFTAVEWGGTKLGR